MQRSLQTSLILSTKWVHCDWINISLESKWKNYLHYDRLRSSRLKMQLQNMMKRCARLIVNLVAYCWLLRRIAYTPLKVYIRFYNKESLLRIQYVSPIVSQSFIYAFVTYISRSQFLISSNFDTVLMIWRYYQKSNVHPITIEGRTWSYVKCILTVILSMLVRCNTPQVYI